MQFIKKVQSQSLTQLSAPFESSTVSVWGVSSVQPTPPVAAVASVAEWKTPTIPIRNINKVVVKGWW